MLQDEKHEFIIISARGGMIEEIKDVALEQFKENDLEFSKYYWKQEDKLEIAKKENIDFMIDDNYDICRKMSENKIKTIYFRDKEMKKLEQNQYLKEVSNWGALTKEDPFLHFRYFHLSIVLCLGLSHHKLSPLYINISTGVIFVHVISCQLC